MKSPCGVRSPPQCDPWSLRCYVSVIVAMICCSFICHLALLIKQRAWDAMVPEEKTACGSVWEALCCQPHKPAAGNKTIWMCLLLLNLPNKWCDCNQIHMEQRCSTLCSPPVHPNGKVKLQYSSSTLWCQTNEHISVTFSFLLAFQIYLLWNLLHCTLNSAPQTKIKQRHLIYLAMKM